VPTSPLYVRLYNFLRNGGRKFFWGGGKRAGCACVCGCGCVCERERERERARAREERERERLGHIDGERAWENKREGMCYMYAFCFLLFIGFVCCMCACMCICICEWYVSMYAVWMN
jgi:hypothetical protein